MLAVIIAVAVFAGAFFPSANQEPAQVPEEVRITDVAEVVEPDEVRDANAENGWYKKTSGGWSFWPEKSTNDEKPPKAVAAKAGNESIETAGGALIFAVLIALAKKLAGGRKKAASVKGGVSQVQYQALMNELSGMNRILSNVMPDNDNGVKAERGRKRR